MSYPQRYHSTFTKLRSEFGSFKRFLKSTQNLNPISDAAIICNLVKLMIENNFLDARGYLEYHLSQSQVENPSIFLSLKGEILGKLQIFDQAIIFIDAAKKAIPTWVKNHYLEALYRLNLGQVETAISSFEQVLKINPHHKPSLIHLGLIYRQHLQKNPEALNYLIKATQNPDIVARSLQAQALSAVAQIYFEAHNYKKALEYAQASLQFNPSDSESRKIIEKLGQNPHSTTMGKEAELMHLGDQYAALDDCMSAQAEFKTAFELNPKLAIAAFKAAQCLYKIGQINEAISWLERAIKSDPTFVDAYLLIADYLSERYHFEKAISYLQQAQKIGKNNADIQKGFGIIEFRKNKYQKAIIHFERALKAFPLNTELLTYTSKCYYHLGQHEKAAALALKALEIEPNYAEAIIAYSWVIEATQGVDVAIKFIKDKLSVFAFSVDLRLALGETLMRAERYQQAEEVFQQVVDYQPNSKKAWLSLGKAQSYQLKIKQAIKSFIQAASIDPWDAEPFFQLAMIYANSKIMIKPFIISKKLW